MSRLKPIPYLLMLAALGLWVSGCATRDVNPSQARANTSYVDFYVDSSGELSWQVERFDDHTKTFKRIYSELEPPTERSLRLALAPGHHRLRVLFMNCFVLAPAVVELDLKDGMITPVHVILASEETAMVDRKEVRVGASTSGRYGRKTRIKSDETVVFKMSAEVEAPIPYQAKEHTVYAH